MPLDLRSVYNGTLFPSDQAHAFRHGDQLFHTRLVRPSARPLALAMGRPLRDVGFASGERRCDLVDYVSLNRVSGLLVIKDGAIRLERYEMGNGPQSGWLSMSIAKTITATLVGVALAEGAIASLDDPLTRYLPRFAGTAYADVSVRQVLQMASGVAWNEDYTDPASDRRQMLEAQMAQQPGAILAHMARLPRAAPPGSRWNYNTGETQVLGEILHAAIRRRLSDYLGEQLWSGAQGMAAPARWWLDSPDGVEIGGSGFWATLHDYGRLGLFLARDGAIGGRQLLPPGWLDLCTAPSPLGPYGYMLWPVEEEQEGPPPGRPRSFEARGIFGQHLYVNRAEQVVIVVWSHLPKPVGSAPLDDRAFFRAVVEALRD